MIKVVLILGIVLVPILIIFLANRACKKEGTPPCDIWY